jgi:GMP synthase (glutamine-hydrolysing)
MASVPAQRDMTADRIVVLDFGAQYSQLIARRIREQGVYCEIHPGTVDAETVRAWKPVGIVLSGGPSSVFDEGAPHFDPAILDIGCPVLGICYGLQLLAHHLGGLVEAADDREYGRALLKIERDDPLFANLEGGVERVAWMSHGDRVLRLPEGFETLATSDGSPFAAVRDRERPLWGVQFHPEVVHTDGGRAMLANFALGICRARTGWSMESFIEEAIERIRDQVGDGRVICGLSGGVDSSVAATLVHRAIGDQLTCIFVDNGLLRADERTEVERLFGAVLDHSLVTVDARDRFLSELKGVIDPEQKRKIIGRVFIEVFQAEADRLGGADYLVQGTLYPDVIESVSVKGQSATIKLGLPEKAIGRHPFPGPGLAVRIIADVTDERLEAVRAADAIVTQEITRAGLYDQMWQGFAVFLPIQTVGVMGDERTYDNVIAVRCVTSVDAMTADWARLPDEVLAVISSRIINEVKGINRVVYDISSKPPATIEWE